MDPLNIVFIIVGVALFAAGAYLNRRKKAKRSISDRLVDTFADYNERMNDFKR